MRGLLLKTAALYTCNLVCASFTSKYHENASLLLFFEILLMRSVETHFCFRVSSPGTCPEDIILSQENELGFTPVSWVNGLWDLVTNEIWQNYSIAFQPAPRRRILVSFWRDPMTRNRVGLGIIQLKVVVSHLSMNIRYTAFHEKYCLVLKCYWIRSEW